MSSQQQKVSETLYQIRQCEEAIRKVTDNIQQIDANREIG